VKGRRAAAREGRVKELRSAVGEGLKRALGGSYGEA